MQEVLLIPVSALAEIQYCPRNFWYRFVEGAEDSNEHVLKGKLLEQAREARSEIDRNEYHQSRSIYLASEKLGLAGVIDVVEDSGSVYPVEYKKGRLKDSLNDDVQVCAQALLLEEHLDIHIPVGYVYYSSSRSRRRVLLTQELRDLVAETRQTAISIIESAVIPDPQPSPRCNGCAMSWRCMPMESEILRKEGKNEVAEESRTEAIGGTSGKVEINGSPDRSRKKNRVFGPVPGVNLGRVLYVDQAGSYIRKKGDTLLVTADGNVIKEVPITNIDEVVLVGRVNLSADAVWMCVERGLTLNSLSHYGQFQYEIQRPSNKNALLRINQVKRHMDPDFCLAVAKEIVEGKLVNMVTVLRRRESYDGAESSPDVSSSIRNIKSSLAAISKCQSLESLLGIEGNASRDYFRALSQILALMGFEFDGRHRRPPSDCVNAMLSFGYSLLCKNVLGSLQVVGLDPYIGFYHQMKYGRPSLALDLMEEFRPAIVDSMVLSMIARRMISEKDFKKDLSSVYLSENGRKAFYKAYETKLSSEITHPVFRYRLPYRRMIEVQARLLGKVIQGEFRTYRAFRIR